MRGFQTSIPSELREISTEHNFLFANSIRELNQFLSKFIRTLHIQVIPEQSTYWRVIFRKIGGSVNKDI
jgi:hypothetical protein